MEKLLTVGYKYFQYVDIDLLHTAKYQRKVKTVKRLEDTWNIKKCGALTVSFRDGKYWVIDGQHRLEILKKLGFKSAACDVLLDLSIEEEASLFSTQNENVNTLKASEKMRADLVAKQEYAIKLQKACDDFNLTIVERDKNKMHLSSALTVMTIAKKDMECIEFIFRLLQNINWDNDKESYTACIISAIAHNYKTFSNDKGILSTTLIKMLGRMTPTELIKMAITTVPREKRMATKIYLENRIRSEMY